MVCANNPCQSPSTSSPTQGLPISFGFSLESRDARAPISASVARDLTPNSSWSGHPCKGRDRLSQTSRARQIMALHPALQVPALRIAEHTPSGFGALHLVLNLWATIGVLSASQVHRTMNPSSLVSFPRERFGWTFEIPWPGTGKKHRGGATTPRVCRLPWSRSSDVVPRVWTDPVADIQAAGRATTRDPRSLISPIDECSIDRGAENRRPCRMQTRGLAS